MRREDLQCLGAPGVECSERPAFATWCDCRDPEGKLSLGSSLFLFCAKCLALDLERDPEDLVFELVFPGRGELLLRPLSVRFYAPPRCELFPGALEAVKPDEPPAHGRRRD